MSTSAVRALHQPEPSPYWSLNPADIVQYAWPIPGSRPSPDRCAEDHQRWPCRTLSALEEPDA